MDGIAWRKVRYEVIRKGRRLVLRRRVDEYSLEPEDYARIMEIRSGAIMPDPSLEGAYVIEANTSGGLRKFSHAIETQKGDPQSDEPASQRLFELGWAPVSTPSVPWTHAAVTSTNRAFTYAALTSIGAVFTYPQSTQSIPEQCEELDSQALLDELRSPRDPQSRRHLVLVLEPLSFNGGQIAELRELLRQFIEENRDSNVPEDLVAVGSAIRKFVGILPADQLGEISFILESGHRAPVAPEIELEVAKMIVRKLTVNVSREPNFLPDLANQLADLARTYLNPRLLPRQYHAAIALNSILALALLRSDLLPEVNEILRPLRAPWFKQLVARRAEEIGGELGSRFPDAGRGHRESLEEVARASREIPH